MHRFMGNIWLNEPESYEIEENLVRFKTKPKTDLWQRTYYGYRTNNAHALLQECDFDFVMSTSAFFNYSTQYDQCGLLIYVDCENWVKVSLEYENNGLSRLGSVVTNCGYSDWASFDVEPRHSMSFRVTRYGGDFLLESSEEGHDFQQMRLLNLQCLNNESVQSSHVKTSPKVLAGLYACSPNESSFDAEFRDTTVTRK